MDAGAWMLDVVYGKSFSSRVRVRVRVRVRLDMAIPSSVFYIVLHCRFVYELSFG